MQSWWIELERAIEWTSRSWCKLGTEWTLKGVGSTHEEIRFTDIAPIYIEVDDKSHFDSHHSSKSLDINITHNFLTNRDDKSDFIRVPITTIGIDKKGPFTDYFDEIISEYLDSLSAIDFDEEMPLKWHIKVLEWL